MSASGLDSGPSQPRDKSSNPSDAEPNSAALDGTRRSSKASRPTTPTTLVAISSQFDVTSSYPAGHHGRPPIDTPATQCVVPCTAAEMPTPPDVLAADSMYSRNGGLYRPSNVSGIIHQAHARSTHAAHHAASLRRTPGGLVNATRAASGSTARVRVAFAAPMPATPSAESAADLRIPHVRHRSKGRTVQGRTATTSASAEMGPSVVTIRGHNAYATPARMRDHRVPTGRARHSATTPVYARTRRRALQRRWTTHGGTPTTSPTAKNGPTGKRYPYAWFCNSPKFAWGFHSDRARPRKSPGLSVRSSFVSKVVAPGRCTKESRTKPPTTARCARRIPSHATAAAARSARTRDTTVVLSSTHGW